MYNSIQNCNVKYFKNIVTKNILPKLRKIIIITSKEHKYNIPLMIPDRRIYVLTRI